VLSGNVARREKGSNMRYSNLWISRLTRESRSKTCGYWYCVTVSAQAHTAFRTRKGLDMWLSQLGLSLGGPLNQGGDCCRIVGDYSRQYVSVEALAALAGDRVRVMSNGDYTDGIITIDDEGHRTINLCGPNEPRVVHDYAESQRIEFGDWVDDEALACGARD